MAAEWGARGEGEVGFSCPAAEAVCVGTAAMAQVGKVTGAAVGLVLG